MAADEAGGAAEAAHVSEDGHWWWDGTQWNPVKKVPPVEPDAAGPAASAEGGAAAEPRLEPLSDRVGSAAAAESGPEPPAPAADALAPAPSLAAPASAPFEAPAAQPPGPYGPPGGYEPAVPLAQPAPQPAQAPAPAAYAAPAPAPYAPPPQPEGQPGPVPHAGYAAPVLHPGFAAPAPHPGYAAPPPHPGYATPAPHPGYQQHPGYGGLPPAAIAPARAGHFAIGGLVAIVGAVALVAGALLPWVTATNPSQSHSGLDGTTDGYFFIGGGAVALLVGALAFRFAHRLLGVVLGLIAVGLAGVVVYEFADAHGKINDYNKAVLPGSSASFAAGLFVLAAGCAVVLVGALVEGMRRPHPAGGAPSAPPSQQPSPYTGMPGPYG